MNNMNNYIQKSKKYKLKLINKLIGGSDCNIVDLVIKYIDFFVIFFQMYPIEKYGALFTCSIGSNTISGVTKCGPTARMLEYLYGFNNDYIYLDYSKENLFISVLNDIQKNNKHTLISIHMGNIDHVFILEYINNKWFIFQSYYDNYTLRKNELSDLQISNLSKIMNKYYSDLSKYDFDKLSNIFNVQPDKIYRHTPDDVQHKIGVLVLDNVKCYDKLKKYY